jgi:hypothetical protein
MQRFAALLTPTNNFTDILCNLMKGWLYLQEYPRCVCVCVCMCVCMCVCVCARVRADSEDIFNFRSYVFLVFMNIVV